MKRYQTIVILIALFSLPALACRLGLKPAQPERVEIPVSTEAAQRFEDNVQQVAADLQTNAQVELKVTEEEFTSFAYYQLLNQGITALSNPQIYLQDGQIELRATYEDGPSPVKVTIIVRPQVEQGKLTLEIVSARLGPAKAPAELVERAQKVVDEQVQPMLNDWLAANLYIQSVSIADGAMVLLGSKP